MNKRIIGYLLIVIGLSIYIYKQLDNKERIIKENNKIEYTLNREKNYKYLDMNNLYDMILIIPKINLKKGIYSKNSKNNNINSNVTINKDSDYPNKENSNVILMAHSGSGNKAFFNDLVKLDNDSLIELYYNHTKYVYKLDTSYCIEKTGKAEIKKESGKKAITLITCNQKDKNKQDIYIGYLIDEIKY